MFGQKPTGLARKTSLALRADSELGYDNRVWRSAALNGGPDPLSLWGSGSSTVPNTLHCFKNTKITWLRSGHPLSVFE
jgi:hypothetical protein